MASFKQFIDKAIKDKSNNIFYKYKVSDKNIKLIRDAEKKSKLTEPKKKISTVKKNNNKKITSTKRIGISASILNQSNLLKTQSKIKKKTLLGG